MHAAATRHETLPARPEPGPGAPAAMLAGGSLGGRLVRLAHLAAALHRTQAAGLIAAVRAHEAGQGAAR